MSERQANTQGTNININVKARLVCHGSAIVHSETVVKQKLERRMFTA